MPMLPNIEHCESLFIPRPLQSGAYGRGNEGVPFTLNGCRTPACVTLLSLRLCPCVSVSVSVSVYIYIYLSIYIIIYLV